LRFVRRDFMRKQVTVPLIAVFVLCLAAAVVSVLSERGRASALNPLVPELSNASVATRTLLTGPPSVVFDVPFDVGALRIPSSGRIAAVVGKDGGRGADGIHVFHVADARSTFARIEATDLILLDDTRALTWTARQGTAEIAEVDVRSGTPGWRVPVPMRSGTLVYEAGTNAWTLSGRDAAGRPARATGQVGGTEVRIASAPSPDGAAIDGWAAAGAAAIAVQNGSPDARIWLSRGSQALASHTLLQAACGSDAASDRRLLCAIHDGDVERIFTLDVEGRAAGGLAVSDASFDMADQRVPGWLIGSSNGLPVALRIASGELLQPAALDEEGPPSVLAVAGSTLATVASTEVGTRIRVYRLNQF